MLRLFRKKLSVHKVWTSQINGLLLITDGHNPLRYVDLATNKVVMYKPKRRFMMTYKVKSND